jgi:hypothetical protein
VEKGGKCGKYSPGEILENRYFLSRPADREAHLNYPDFKCLQEYIPSQLVPAKQIILRH